MKPRFCVTFILFQLLRVQLCDGISCKDENNNDVDWFIIYKFPKLQDKPAGSFMRLGSAYAFLTSSTQDNWTLSSQSILSPSSMLGKTWRNFKNSKNIISQLFYNDEPPVDSGRTSGHLKGFFAFDSSSGYWLTHSIPKFGQAEQYEYPSNGLNNGQHALCISLRPEAMNEICNHLLFCHPKRYSQFLSEEGQRYLDLRARSLFARSPAFVRSSPFHRESFLESRNKVKFFTFAKDNQFDKDFYTSVLAPGLRTSLIAETWRRGAGSRLDPTCATNYSVLHITEIRMKPSNTPQQIFFSSSEDHSKWAISMDASRKWVCVADLNRMESQEKRGGGSVCFQSKPAWKSFRSLVANTDLCPIR